MTNPNWFKSQRGIALSASILMFILATLLPAITGFWSLLGKSNPAVPITHSLLRNSDFRSVAGQEFVNKLSSDATGDAKSLLAKKSNEISAAVSDLLSQPAFESEVDKITNTAYEFYVNGSQNAASIDVKPLASLALSSLSQVDKQFSKLKKEVDKVKPIELKPLENGPNFSQIRKNINLIFYLVLVFFILLNLLYVRYAKNLPSALRIVGSQFVYTGVIGLAINLVGNSVVSNIAEKNSQPLAKVAIPIVAHQELGIFMTFGGIALIVGLIPLVISFTRYVAPKQN